MAKNIIFTINTKNGKVNGKRTSHGEYFYWNGEKFKKCRKRDIEGVDMINFKKF